MTLPEAPLPIYPPDVIRAVVGIEDVKEPVAEALRAYSRGQGESRVVVFAPAGPDGDVHLKSAWLPDREIFVVKIATWFAARAVNGHTANAGVVAAFDARTGDLRALLNDEHHLSDVRTAAAGGLAARALARPDSTTLAVIGTGVQAYMQALAAAAELPLMAVRIWGRDVRRARNLARAIRRRLPHLELTIAASVAAACETADVVITATASTEPLIDATMLSPGMHITAVGADDPHKIEISAQALAQADLIAVDSRQLAARFGDLAAAGANADVELGDVLADPTLGRSSPQQITVCKLIGLGVQDLAAAEVALHRLESGSRPTIAPASSADLHSGR